MQTSHDWFCFSFAEKVARVSLTNHRANQKTDIRMGTTISKSFQSRDVPNMIDD